MTHFTYARGAGFSLIGSGPIFVTVLALGDWLLSGELDAVTNQFGILLLMLPFSVFFGIVLGVIPIASGGLLMGWAGTHADWCRHPIAWTISGGMLGALMGLLFGAGSKPDPTALFAITGAICALIVRHGTRWDDEAPANLINAQEGEAR